MQVACGYKFSVAKKRSNGTTVPRLLSWIMLLPMIVACSARLAADAKAR